MTTFDIAHVKEQGINLIIVPLASSFGSKPSIAQRQIINGLETAARTAGLAGTVVPIWPTGHGHQFIAPQNWHPFFKSISWQQVMASINKRLTIH